MSAHNPLEFYETPRAFTQFLLIDMASRGMPIHGSLFEPCVGDGAIVKAAKAINNGLPATYENLWTTNDLDKRWAADFHEDMTSAHAWETIDVIADSTDWTISNTPFTPALDIIEHAIEHSRVGVAMHLRASIHEVLKTGKRRTWMNRHLPTGCLWLPRFAYQRSPTTGKWTTDSVCACWLIWIKPNMRKHRNDWQFFGYAPEAVINQLNEDTPEYRERMDALMGFTGTEEMRQLQAQGIQ